VSVKLLKNARIVRTNVSVELMISLPAVGTSAFNETKHIDTMELTQLTRQLCHEIISVKTQRVNMLQTKKIIFASYSDYRIHCLLAAAVVVLKRTKCRAA